MLLLVLTVGLLALRVGPLYAPFFVYFQSYLVFGLVMLVRAYRAQPSSFKRNRTLLVILGSGTLAGLANGLLVTRVGIAPFIARM